MRIELCIDSYESAKDIKTLIDDNKQYINALDTIALSMHQLYVCRYISNNIVNVWLDDPIGKSTYDARLSQVKKAINKKKVSTITLQIPVDCLVNQNYKYLEKELTQLHNINTTNIEFRYILDYRHYTHNSLVKICNILKSYNISTIYLSNGLFADNVYDGIIAAEFLTRKSKIHVMFNCNMWTDKHISLVELIEPKGYSTKSLHFAKKIIDKYRGHGSKQ